MNFYKTTRQNGNKIAFKSAGFFILSICLTCTLAINLSFRPQFPSWTIASGPFKIQLKNLAIQWGLLEFIDSSSAYIPEWEFTEINNLHARLDFSVTHSGNRMGAWHIESLSNEQSRWNLIKEILQRSHNDSQLLMPIPGMLGLYQFNVSSQTVANASLSRPVGTILPGETLIWNYDPALPMSHTFYFSMKGATADRLDSPALLKVTLPQGQEASFPISPKGSIEKIELPQLQTAASLQFHWSPDAAGILVFHGAETRQNKQKQEASDAQNESGSVYLITIDSILPNSLSKTQAFLSHKFGKDHVINRDSFYPLTTDALANTIALFTNVPPIESGINGDSILKNILTEHLPTTLENSFFSTGFSLHRINIGHQYCQHTKCEINSEIQRLLGLSSFDTLASFSRVRNIREISSQILNQINVIKNNSFVHININFPAENIRPTWKSINRYKNMSTFESIANGVMIRTGLSQFNSNLLEEEKSLQIDDLLSESLQNIEPNSKVIILNQIISEGKSENLKNGELLAASNTFENDSENANNKWIGSQGDLTALLPLLIPNQKKNNALPQTFVWKEDKNKISFSLKGAHLVSQVTDDGENFILPGGSIFIPTANSKIPEFYDMPISKLSGAKNIIEKLRQSQTSHTVHFLFSDRKSDARSFSFDFKTSLEVLKCESNRKETKTIKRLLSQKELGTQILVSAELQGENMGLWHIQCHLKGILQNKSDSNNDSQLAFRFFSSGERLSPTSVGLGAYGINADLNKDEQGFMTVSPLDVTTTLTSNSPPLYESLSGIKVFLWKDAHPYQNFDLNFPIMLSSEINNSVH